MIDEKQIIDFIETEFWKSNLDSNSDIFNSLRIDGDDCEELLKKYTEKYNVDMSLFIWYFHYQEEASLSFRIGRLFFKNPYDSVKQISITPKLLTEFALTKKWNIDYPEHKLSKYRYDLLIDWIFIIGFFITIYYLKR